MRAARGPLRVVGARSPRRRAAILLAPIALLVALALAGRAQAAGDEPVARPFGLEAAVTARDGGEPVAHTRVWAVGGLADDGRGGPAEHFWSRPARTDADGVARWRFASRRRVEALVVDRGARTAAHVERLDPAVVLSHEGARFRVVQARPGPGARVSGRVSTPDGAPVPGARVHLREELPFGLGEAFAPEPLPGDPGLPVGDDGRFELAGVGRSFALTASAPGRLPLLTWTGRLEAGEHLRGLGLYLARSVRLAGRIEHEGGAPGARLTVMITPPEALVDRARGVLTEGVSTVGQLHALAPGHVTHTDADGRFALDVPDHPMRISAGLRMFPLGVAHRGAGRPEIFGFADYSPSQGPLDLVARRIPQDLQR